MYISLLKPKNNKFMNSKTTISISEARKRIFELAREVQKPDNYYTLTDKGRPRAVLMSVEQFESWQETLEVMREFPNLDKDAAQAMKEYKEGNFITLEELLAKEGFVVADRNKKKYGISADSAKKSSKRN
jgi:prevent-host-death family protein